MEGCLEPGSQCWSIATFRGHGYSIRIRINASRHDSRQEPYAVVPHVRICAGGGEQSPSLPRPAWHYSKAIYKRRNEIERLFRRLKGFRRIFSRFDKLDVMFIAFIHFALIADALKWC